MVSGDAPFRTVCVKGHPDCAKYGDGPCLRESPDAEDENGNFVRTKRGGLRIPETLATLSDPTRDTLVSVVWTKQQWTRHGFHTHVCVQGQLQQHPDREHAYRVLVGRATYAYLEVADVTAIMGRPETRFKDGSSAVIYVE